MNNIILHVDVNNFFASVTIRNNPSLSGKPVIICGDPDMRHGIVLAKSNEAKRLGIKTTQTILEAKKLCPNVICLPPDYAQYYLYSEKLFNIYKRYTPLVESFGLDECWLDISGSIKLIGKSPVNIAHEIRETVKAELGITVSIGVSFTKVFAKLGSDLKKPDAVSVISKDNYKQIAWVLPISEMIYIGESVRKSLYQLNIKTIGDLATANVDLLTKKLGKTGKRIYDYANGIDGEKVGVYNEPYIPESISNGMTIEEDIIIEKTAKSLIYSLSELVAFRLRKYRLIANGIGVTIKNSEFQIFTKQQTLLSPTSDAEIIGDSAFKMVTNHMKISEKNPIRTITISAYHLVDESYNSQISFFNIKEHNHLEIDNKLDKIRQKYGYSILKKAIELDNTFTSHQKIIDENFDES